MKNKTDFINHFAQFGKTDSWANLAKEYNFISGEAARSFIQRKKRFIKEPNNKLENFKIKSFSSHVKYRIVDKVPVKLIETKTDYKPDNFLFKDEFKNFVKNYKIPAQPLKEYDLDKSGKLLVINIFDLHLAKFSWAVETGEDYDINITKKRFLKCVISIIRKASAVYNINEIVLCNGGDFMHIDNKFSTTTAGTYVESDSRYQKVFKVALELLTESINILYHFCKKITFINVQGNHDEQVAYYLGVALEAVFQDNENIVIENSPRMRKYYRYGNNLMMFTHGDKRPDALPLTFAVENKNFSECPFRFIHLGHLHKSTKKYFSGEDEFNGVVVRTYNSISGQDAWHTEESYVKSNKKATGLIYDYNDGPISEFYEIIK